MTRILHAPRGQLRREYFLYPVLLLQPLQPSPPAPYPPVETTIPKPWISKTTPAAWGQPFCPRKAFWVGDAERRAWDRREGAQGGADSGVEFSRARALRRRVSSVNARVRVACRLRVRTETALGGRVERTAVTRPPESAGARAAPVQEACRRPGVAAFLGDWAVAAPCFSSEDNGKVWLS